jgi:o-succinylbenzoate---CoA ligase
MIPNYNAIHNKFRLNGSHYTFNKLKDVAYSYIKEGKPYEKHIGEFLLQWTDSSKTVTVKTSGSTGKPKTIKLYKQAMVHSAIATGDYFNLKPSNSALLCLPATYIAGKMMIVRAIILGLQLDLVEPSSRPLELVKRKYQFAAMVPMQLRNSLGKLSKIKTLIVGGAKVSDDLENKIQNCSTVIYATYGMTETITHIAVKKLNRQPSSKFEVLPNVQITQDERDCLVINVPYISKAFELLGRFDNVINSGGIKIHPEQLETKLTPFIKTDFFIASRENETLGEEVILVIEGQEQKLLNDVFKSFDKHEIPKEVLFLKTFKRTVSGKINRTKTLESSKR